MDVREKIESGVYTNTQKYPEHASKPRLSSNATAAQARLFAVTLENYEKNKETIARLRAEYNLEEARLNHLFRVDAIEEVFGDDASRFPGLVNYLYGKAYESGHGSGFHEVLSQLEQYSDIVTVIVNDFVDAALTWPHEHTIHLHGKKKPMKITWKDAFAVIMPCKMP